MECLILTKSIDTYLILSDIALKHRFTHFMLMKMCVKFGDFRSNNLGAVDAT